LGRYPKLSNAGSAQAVGAQSGKKLERLFLDEYLFKLKTFKEMGTWGRTLAIGL